jgi:hypothetical protein
MKLLAILAATLRETDGGRLAVLKLAELSSSASALAGSSTDSDIPDGAAPLAGGSGKPTGPSR